MGDSAANGHSVLEILGICYGAGTVGHVPTPDHCCHLGGSLELDLWPVFSDLRILGGRADNEDSILKVLCVSYVVGMAGR